MSFARLTAIVRDADWLDAERAKTYVRILALVQLAGLAGLLLCAQKTGLDARGEPIGTDFVSFWTAARMAVSGAAAAIYDPAAHHAAEQAAFGAPLDWYAFFYPPIYLLLLTPLAALPYFGALATWIGATFAAYALTLRQFAKSLLLPILAFPAALSTIGHGQNAFFTTALFAGGALLLDRRPFGAGLLLGALCYKPHLAAMVPLALLVAGRKKAFAGFVAGVAALLGLSLLAFGAPVWLAFLAEGFLARATLEQGFVEPGKMQSAFAALRVWGAPLWLAYGVQAITSLAAALALIRLLRRTRDPHVQMAATALAALLATPFLLDYDLTLLALPLTVAMARAMRDGFLPYEKTALLAAYLLPAVARPLALHALLPLSPLVLALFFARFLARRAAREAGPGATLSRPAGGGII